MYEGVKPAELATALKAMKKEYFDNHRQPLIQKGWSKK